MTSVPPENNILIRRKIRMTMTILSALTTHTTLMNSPELSGFRKSHKVHSLKQASSHSGRRNVPHCIVQQSDDNQETSNGYSQ
ncbi:MAG: hypothetical protein WAM89_10575 [Terriglobales bacterium]